MSKTIKKDGLVITKLNFYEKYIQLDHEERKTFLRFALISLSSIAVILIPLVISFKEKMKCLILIGIFIWIILLVGYLFLYKKPKISHAYFLTS